MEYSNSDFYDGEIGSYKLKKEYRITPEERKLNACINRINDMICQLTTIEEYENAITYIDDIIYFNLLDITKEEVINKNICKHIKNEPCVFFEEKFYQEDENDRIKIKKNTYNILREFFNNYGIANMCELFLKIEKCLAKKDYLLELEENNENITLTEAYEILDIDRTEDINSNTLTKIYRKKALLFHPDKHPENKEKFKELFNNIYKAYKFLLKRI